MLHIYVISKLRTVKFRSVSYQSAIKGPSYDLERVGTNYVGREDIFVVDGKGQPEYR